MKKRSSVRNPNPSGKRVFRRYFKHWRSGKTYDAWDYGYKSWPIG
ncbi:hypothetical protein [Bdellovibrio bacteriovorus]|nr:hypothetical protein [Bdellovibrio bacteriovorus]